ncbi:LacI family DNA-binding transcriptional regulator [Bacillus kwashiorkori]|uniref:LacI family DNA-binding transcriptional regulator n=1 Tax=Bacillus kwashiorkori TaxID=1522318 RepID=UPI0007853E2E|nr:LacI family DNA-binding transcriptional regulator [Bacillus kwashiorkori]
MITINEIAKLAQVSRTTVSRVLNNSGYVSDEARKRVLKVIEETGYTPSQQARSLRTKETKVVGVILPRISTETASKVVAGIDSVLSEAGYQILLANTNLQMEKELEYIQLLVNRQVDGIILLATNVLPELVAKVEQLSIPIVAVGQTFPNITSVVYDDYHAAKTLTKKFIEKGKTKIAFIGVKETDEAVGVSRKNGFLDAMRENGLEVREEWLITGSFESKFGYQAMKTIFTETDTMPDAVFAATDRLAIGVMSYLKEQNIQIPEQMSIAGIGSSEISKYMSPSLTTVQYENEHAGEIAATILLRNLQGEHVPPEKIILSYRLIKRDSL